MNESTKTPHITMALLLIGILLASIGAIGIASSIDPEGFSSVYNKRRWNPPTYLGVFGIKTTLVWPNGITKSCAIGFPVYNVTEHEYYNPPLSLSNTNPEFSMYYTRYWAVTSGHCARPNSEAYQPDTSGAHIGYAQYTTYYNSFTTLVDAALIHVDTQYDTEPEPSDVIAAKVLVLRFPIPSLICVYTLYNTTIKSIEQGEETAEELYYSQWPIYHAGPTTGYTVTDVWDYNGNRVRPGLLSPEMSLATFADNHGGVFKTYVYKVRNDAITPCLGTSTDFANPGDSGSPAFVYIGEGDDLRNPRDVMILGLIEGGNETVTYVVPASKIIERLNSFYDYLNLRLYNGTVAP